MYSKFSGSDSSNYFMPGVSYIQFERELNEILFDLVSDDSILFKKIAELFVKHKMLFPKDEPYENPQNLLQYSQTIVRMEQAIRLGQKNQEITTLYRLFEDDKFNLRTPFGDDFLSILYVELTFLLDFQRDTLIFLAYPLLNKNNLSIQELMALKAKFIAHFKKNNSSSSWTLWEDLQKEMRKLPYLQLSHFVALLKLSRFNNYFKRLNTAFKLHKELPTYYASYEKQLKDGIQRGLLKLIELQHLDPSFKDIVPLYKKNFQLMLEETNQDNSTTSQPIYLNPTTCLVSTLNDKQQILNPMAKILASNESYLDSYRLFKTQNYKGSPSLDSHHLAWFLNAAMLLDARINTDPQTQKTLEFLTLQAYFNIAQISCFETEYYGVQRTFRNSKNYYRTSLLNPALDLLEMKLSSNNLQTNNLQNDFSAIQNTLFEEVIKRLGKVAHLADDVITIDSIEKFRNFLVQFKKNKPLGRNIFINITPLLNKEKLESFAGISEKLSIEFSKYFKNQRNIIEKLAARIKPLGVFSFQGLCFVYHPCLIDHASIPSFSTEWNKHIRHIRFLIKNNNSPPSPEDTLRALVESETIENYFKRVNIPFPSLTTPRKSPVVCKDYFSFMAQPIVEKFKNLSEPSQVAPYLKVLPKAIWELFDGLKEFNTMKEKELISLIDLRFQEKNLTDLLQYFYYLMMEAMNQALLYREDFAIFQNCLIVISQQLLAILSITSPHAPKDLNQAVVTKFTQGPNPIINKNLPTPKAYGKLSSFHGLGSIRAGVEAQKQSISTLNILLDRKIYYEITEEMTKSFDVLSLDKVMLLDSQLFLENKNLEEAVHPMSDPHHLIDLFIGHFQEPCSPDQTCYRPIPLLEQVKTLIEKGWVANSFTVAIDTTLSLELSSELRDFFADSLIQKKIISGNLNVCLFRSAQKCAMFGLDNFFAGLLMTVNQADSFKAFNERVAAPEDQLTGQAFQALTTIQKYSTMLDVYRQGLIDNTRKLYECLPKAMIYDPNHSNPIQVSQIEDQSCIFLDIKFVNSPQTCKAFIAKLKDFAREKNLIVYKRMGFGFLNTTTSDIQADKVWRITPGLEKAEDIETLAHFFQILQNIIDHVWTPQKHNDSALAEAIRDNFSNFASNNSSFRI